MSDKIKRISAKEFRDFGYLQELNRQFLHPLGLALEVVIDNATGDMSIGGVHDCRDDPEGFVYDDAVVDYAKVARIQVEWNERKKERLKGLGFMVQPASLSELLD